MGGFSKIVDIMRRIKQRNAGPGQQYTFDPAAQRYNAVAGAASPASPAQKVTFNPAEQKYSKEGMKKGGNVKKMAKGGVTRADGCAQRGKTKGKFV